MCDYIYLDLDGKGECGLWETWEARANYVPFRFIGLICDGVDVDTAADLADDGLPVCADPPKIADDGELVAVWLDVFEEAF